LGILHILTNGGDGEFVADAPRAVSSGAEQIVAAHLDGSDLVDLAWANGSNGTIEVLWDGDGPVASFGAGRGAESLVAIDVDGGGDTDLAAAAERDGEVVVLTNEGERSFVRSAPIQVGTKPETIAAGDLDGDGRPELVVTTGVCTTMTCYVGSLIVIDNREDGFVAREALPVGRGPRQVIVADLDGDRDLDVAVTNNFSGDVTLFENDMGTLTASVWAGLPFAFGIDAADLDGDCMLDVIVAEKARVSLDAWLTSTP
jgi:hypothetical protein